MMTDEKVEDFLAHYGVKGMRWGVRKDREKGSGRKRGKKDDGSETSKKKKAAIILGAAVGVAAIAAGGYYANKHLNVKVSDVKNISDRAKNYTQAMGEEPLGIVHAARGKNKGFTFPGRGGLSNPLSEYERAGFDKYSSTEEFFNRYGDNLEKVAARFLDPEKRVDRAGRDIFHEVILPKDLAEGVTNISDAEEVAWPLIKDVYDAFYKD